MIEALFSTLKNLTDIWAHENALKYQKELLKLKEKYNEENDKEKPDCNILDHIERNIVQLAGLVDSEIKRQKA